MTEPTESMARTLGEISQLLDEIRRLAEAEAQRQSQWVSAAPTPPGELGLRSGCTLSDSEHLLAIHAAQRHYRATLEAAKAAGLELYLDETESTVNEIVPGRVALARWLRSPVIAHQDKGVGG